MRKRTAVVETCSEQSCEGDSCEVLIEYVPKQVQGGQGLTREVMSAFCASVRKGTRKSVVAAKLHIPLTTFNYWMSQGKIEIRLYEAERRDSIGLYGEFFIQVRKAEADFHEQCVDIILQNGDPKLVWQYLQKRFPKIYSSTSTDDDDSVDAPTAPDALEALTRRMQALKPSMDS